MDPPHLPRQGLSRGSILIFWPISLFLSRGGPLKPFALDPKLSPFLRGCLLGGGVTFCMFLQQNKLFITGLKCCSRQKKYDIQTVN